MTIELRSDWTSFSRLIGLERHLANIIRKPIKVLIHE